MDQPQPKLAHSASSGVASRRRIWPWLAAAVVVAAAIAAVYWLAPQGERIFDDIPLLGLACNDGLGSFSLHGACGYRPIRHLSFAVSGSIFGPDNNRAHHVINIVLHGLAAVGVVAVMRRLLGDRGAGLCGVWGGVWVGGIAAAFFAVHPAQVDAVAYMSGRRDVLCGLFYIGSLYAFIRSRDAGRRRRSGGWLVLAVVCWALALGTKEMAVTLPAVALWYELTVRAGHDLDRPGLVARIGSVAHRYGRWVALGVSAAAAFVVYRGFVDTKSLMMGTDRWWGGTWWTNAMTGVSLHRYYAELTLIPWRLPGDWNTPMILPVKSATAPRFWAGLGVLVAVLAAIVASLRRQRNLMAFGLGFYVIALTPVLQIIPHHEIFAEHYLYIPLVGASVAVAAGLRWMWEAADALDLRRLVGLAAAGLALVALATQARMHVGDYRNSYTLAQATLRWAPNHPRAMLRAGSWLADHERWDEAQTYLVGVLQADHATAPLRRPAYQMLGLHYLSTGQSQRFQTVARRAAADFPNHPTFRGLHAVALLQQSQRRAQRRAAIERLIDAAQQPRSVADINFLAARQCRRLGRLDQAVDLLEAGVDKDPDNARLKLALAYLLSQPDRSPTEHRRARRLVDALLEQAPTLAGVDALADALERSE